MQHEVRERVMAEIEEYATATTAMAPEVMKNPVAEYIEPALQHFHRSLADALGPLPSAS